MVNLFTETAITLGLHDLWTQKSHWKPVFQPASPKVSVKGRGEKYEFKSWPLKRIALVGRGSVWRTRNFDPLPSLAMKRLAVSQPMCMLRLLSTNVWKETPQGCSNNNNKTLRINSRLRHKGHPAEVCLLDRTQSCRPGLTRQEFEKWQLNALNPAPIVVSDMFKLIAGHVIEKW